MQILKHVDTIKIIKYLKVLQHVSDHRRSNIREPCTVLSYNYKNNSIVSVDTELVVVMAAYCNSN
jgi:hypothetical protein